VFAAGVTLAAWLAWRVGGPVAAGFAAVAIVGSPLMLLDVGKAYAVAWALLPWLIAAWAVLAPNPRYWLAAFALLVAALIRIETLVVVPGALLAIVLARIAHRADPSVVPRAALAIVFVPMLAIPVMAAHDWLLTGDPLFWVQVSTRFAEAASVRGFPGLQEVSERLVERFGADLAFLLLAGLAGFRLWRDRQLPLLVGLLVFGFGILAFLFLLAVRGLFVSPRYLAPIDLVLALSAGIGLGALRLDGVRRAGDLLPMGALGLPVQLVVGGLVAVALSHPFVPFDANIRDQLAEEARSQRAVASAVPVVRDALGRLPGARDPVPGVSWWTSTPPHVIAVFAPGLSRPRLAVDLDLPLSRIAGIETGVPDPPVEGIPRPGQIYVHDRRADRPEARYSFLEVSSPTPLGDVVLVPLLADETRGLWVIEIRAAS
jgi:hypothetical protein